MVFADINADKYTDLVLLDADSNTIIQVYIFNPKLITFEFFVELQTQDTCKSIQNIAIGRS